MRRCRFYLVRAGRLPAALLLAVALLLAPLPAGAETRVALVIGNSAYAYQRPLPNPANDAADIAAALRAPALGFQVELLLDQDAAGMRAALERFAERASRADVALVYYAGHGVQGRSEDRRSQVNYLVPKDARIRREADLPREAVTLDALFNSMDGAGVSIVILDACRDNPQQQAMQQLDGAPRGGGSRGLAPLSRVQVNTLVAFATLPGETAADGTGRNSPFTGALLRHLATPGLEVRQMLSRVRAQVYEATGHEQVPDSHDRLLGSVFLAQGAPPPVTVSPPPPPPPPSSGYPVAVGQSFRDCPDCPEMVVIPPGRFTMGSPVSEPGRNNDEGPQHDVALRMPLAVGRTHVTVGEYRAFVAATGRSDGPSCWTWPLTEGKSVERPGLSWRNPGFRQTERDPVVCVNWDDAQAYASWLSGRTGRGYRLLTESEFEYAARAGTTTRWWWGEDEAAQCRFANGLDQTAQDNVPGAGKWALAPCRDGFSYTSPAGSFTANGFGLVDMAGNAWQWVADCYRDSYAGAPADASAVVMANNCSARVLRGGSWFGSPQFLRSANRDWFAPGDRISLAGFRLARTPAP